MHASRTSGGTLTRDSAALVIFVLCCLLSSARLIVEAPNPTHLEVDDDVAQRADLRFAPLKALLPPTGVIGYIGENSNSGTAAYYLAQYTLAPRVVDRSPDHAWVIGNFPSLRPSPSPENLRLVKDFGDGLLLFSNKDAQ